MADSNSTPSFYVYIHRRATDGKIFYVGKGYGNRSHSLKSRNQHWKNTVAKHGYTIEFIKKDIQEWYAFELEIELIAYYGRDNLCNKTDGGDGSQGLKHSKESLIKMSLSSSGKTHSIETKRKMSEWQKSKKLTAGHKLKISESNSNRVLSEESRLKNLKSQPNRKPVLYIETNEVFNSIKEASRKLGLSSTSIINSCNGQHKKTKDMNFKYET